MISLDFAKLLDIITDKALDKKITLFMGSGCDYSSGGNTFRNLKENAVDLYNLDNYTLDGKFNEFLRKATPEQKSALLSQTQDLEDMLTPSECYKLLILLIEKKIFHSVFTTNFYPVMEKAQKSLNKDVLDIYSANDKLPVATDNLYRKERTPYFKLHGNVVTHYVSHLTDDDLNNLKLSTSFYSELEHACVNNILIFVGYSGEDALLCKYLASWIINNKYVFFINPSGLKAESHLAQELGEERISGIHQINITFDDFIIETSKRVLHNYQMTDCISFIKPLIDISTNSNCIKSISEQSYIPRKILDNEIEEFIQSDKNLFILSGYAGKGKKTYLDHLNANIKKDFNCNPIYCMQKYPDIVKNMTAAIGYNANDDISVIYQFAKWAESNRHKYIFINNITDSQLNKNSLDEFSQLVYRCAHIKSVKFLISVDLKFIENNRNLFSSPLFKATIYSSIRSCVSYKLDDFTNDELVEVVNINYLNSNEIFYLLKEPAILSMYIKRNCSLPKAKLSKFSYISEYFSVSNYNIKALKNYALSLYKKQSVTPPEDSLIDTGGEFYNPLFFSYFLGRAWIDENYFKPSKNINNDYDYTQIISQINDILVTNENTYLTAMMFAVGDSLKALHIAEICKLLLKNSKNSNINLFVQNLLNYLATNSEEKFSQIICNIHNYPHIISKVAYSCMLVDDANAIERFTTLINCCSLSLCDDELRLLLQLFSKKCYELVRWKMRFDTVFEGLCNLDNANIKFLLVFKLLSSMGIDNTPKFIYNQIVSKSFDLLINCDYNSKEICDYFKCHSSQLLFNENDVEHAYALISQNSVLKDILEKIVYYNKLDSDDLIQIMSYAKDIEASTRFFILNIALLQLCRNEQYSVDKIAKSLFEIIIKDENLCVTQCDFILSFVFLGSYLINQRENTANERWLNVFFADEHTEQIMFDMPGEKRTLVFHDSFDRQFEDGFNPFAFYFYIAPAYLLDNKYADWDCYDKLSIYWSQSEKLRDSGNTNKILRFVHAVGQMIELWPVEGFDVLAKFLKYDEPCLHRALERLLQEFYVKYPEQTENFLMLAGTYFDEKEIKKIKSASDTRLYTRSMEQLHWIRLLSIFINKNPNFFNNLLSLCIDRHSFDEFFTGVLKLVVNQDNDGIIDQTG